MYKVKERLSILNIELDKFDWETYSDVFLQSHFIKWCNQTSP